MNARSTRPPPAGWQRQSRRAAPADVRSGTARRAEMSEPVASYIFHLRRGNSRPTVGRNTENGLPRPNSRDAGENSNARFVGTPSGSGFIAAMKPAAAQIFSPDCGSQAGNPAVDRQRLRVNVNALIGHEEQHGVGDFPARRHPPERSPRRASRRPAGAGVTAERSVDQARDRRCWRGCRAWHPPWRRCASDRPVPPLTYHRRSGASRSEVRRSTR